MALCFAVALFATPALAASRVVVLRPAGADPGSHEAAARLEGELRAAGFDVVVVDPPAGAPVREALERAATGAHAFAAVAVLHTPGGAAAELIVVDRVTHKTVIRTVEIRGRPAESPAKELAILAVELLQASLLEVTEPPPASRAGASASARVPPDVSKWMKAPSAPLQGLAFAGGLGVLQSTGGIGPAFTPLLRASYGSSFGWFGRLSVVGPAAGAALEGSAGSSSVRQELAVLELGLARELGSSSWVLVPSVGFGAYHLAATGSLRAPHRGGSDDLWASVLDAGAGVGLRLNDNWTAILDVHALITQPEPVVVAAGERLGAAGRPSLLFSLEVASRLGR